MAAPSSPDRDSRQQQRTEGPGREPPLPLLPSRPQGSQARPSSTGRRELRSARNPIPLRSGREPPCESRSEQAGGVWRISGNSLELFSENGGSTARGSSNLLKLE